MSIGEIYLTPEGHDKLIEELDYLEKTKRREISKALSMPVL